ncbi:unnamed protein product [marine sediment metagenome]|uniref:N-acetyltransferase domain-containing protein n=1 Tax=marine sediment metagenome TaxID=412755 RepID=X1S0C9_9ZZZZ
MIKGKQVTLRPAIEQDKYEIFKWLAESDVTVSMMGPPKFPDNLVPTWEEFCADYKQYYFDDSAPELGRCFVIMVNDIPVGQVNYNDIHQNKHRTELDIWMSCEMNCGKGYGPDAIQALCEYLFQTYGVIEFVIRPSERNPRAVHAYKKAGFRRIDISHEELIIEYGPGDTHDTVLLIKQMS